MNGKNNKNFIKYPYDLYKAACLQGWEKPFALLFDLKRVFAFSVIQDYRSYNKIQPLLSKKICAKTYFKYLRVLVKHGLVKKAQYALILPAYSRFEGRFRTVKIHNHIDRMRAQHIRRLCDKQSAKIRTGVSSIQEIKHLKCEGSSLAFDVVNLQATVRLSCRTLNKLYNKRIKSRKEWDNGMWGFRLKKRLKNLGLISIKNTKELLDARPTDSELMKGVRLFSGAWIRQHADQIHAYIELNEKEKLVENTLDLRMQYCYGYYDCYD